MRRGIESRSARSSLGSRSCWVNTSVERGGNVAREQRLRIRQRGERRVHRERGDLQRRNSARADSCATLRIFRGRGGEHIFVDEALLRQRGGEGEPCRADRLVRDCVGKQRGAQRGQHALERKVAHRRRTQQVDEQRIALGRRAAFSGEQLIGREPARPGGIGVLHGLGERRQHRGKRRNGAGKLVVKLRRERQRAGKARRGLGELALRLQYAAEIVQGLGMVGLEREQFLIGAGGVVEPALPLKLRGLPEQLAHDIAGGARRRALHVRGAALFAVHRFAFPDPAALARPVSGLRPGEGAV